MRIHHILTLAILALALLTRGAVAAEAPATDPEPATTAETPAAEPADPKPDAAADEPKEPTAEDLFTEGRDAMFKGQYQQAVDLLTKAVAADKAKTSYRLHLARAYRYAGKDDEAAKHLDEILKKSPDHVEAGQALGEIHAAAKRWKDVVRVLEPLLTFRHDYPTYHMLAEAQYNLGEHTKARKLYEEAVKLNPQSASDHYQLGNIYLAGNFFARAAESYQSALRLGLDSPVLRYKLGSAYFNLRNYFGKISTQTVKSGKPGTINGRSYLIEPVPGQKDAFRCAPEASAAYQVARAIADGIEDRSDIHVLRATIYLNAHRYAQAYAMFTEIGDAVTAGDAVPDADKALFHYYHAQAAFGAALNDTGQLDRYLELLAEAIKLDSVSYESTLVDAYLKVADQHNQAGRLDKYIEFLAKAVVESPGTASLHLRLGDAYEEAEKTEQAVSQWRMVLDIEPEHPRRMKLLNQIEKHRIGLSLSVTGGEEPVPEEPVEPKPEQ